MAESKAVRSKRKTSEVTPEQVKKKLRIKIVMPADNDNYFKDIIGNKRIVNEFVEIAKILKSPQANSILGSEFHPSFFLLGLEGIGKVLTTFAFAKEMELPIIVIDIEKLLQDCSDEVFEAITELVRPLDPCVVLYKGVEYGSQLEVEKSVALYTQLCMLKNTFPNSYFFASASQTTAYPPFFISDEGFTRIIQFITPDADERCELIKKFISNMPHDPKIDFVKLAKEFIGSTAGDIYETLNHALVNAVLAGKNKLTYEIISNEISDSEFGNKTRKMSDKEIAMTAYHEVGHVIAGYYGCPDYVVGKVEVICRENTLGLTSQEVDEEKLSYTREDVIGHILVSYGGMDAEKLVFGTTTTGVEQDLMNAMTLATNYVKRYGMDPNFGPIYVDDDDYYSDTLSAMADVKVRELLLECEKRTMAILIEHRDKLEEITEALIKKETLYKEDILKILKRKSRRSSKK